MGTGEPSLQVSIIKVLWSKEKPTILSRECNMNHLKKKPIYPSLKLPEKIVVFGNPLGIRMGLKKLSTLSSSRGIQCLSKSVTSLNELK